MPVTEGPVVDLGLNFIELKTYQYSDWSDSKTGECLAIDQNTKNVFVCYMSKVSYSPLETFLDFDVFTKESLKKVEKQISSKTTFNLRANRCNAHLLSISNKGFGSKLAVGLSDQGTNSLFLYFYDLKTLYTQSDKAVFYTKFVFSVPSPGKTRIRMLSWHPEMSDNVLACSLTDGSFYLLYISDYGNNSVILLDYLASEHNVTSFSWSPKGKQIVLGFKTPTFAQYKFQLDEKSINQKITFAETKKTTLTELVNFGNYQIMNICWISTFVFLVVVHDADRDDTSYLIVSIPSQKAAAQGALTQIYNHMNINLDLGTDVLRVDCLQLENLIFTLTSRSNEVALMGCPSIADMATPNKWATVDTEKNLILGEDKVVRGLAVTSGVEKYIQFGSNTKGGPNTPLAVAYNNTGNITVFLCEGKEGTVNVSAPPAPLKPACFATASAPLPQQAAAATQPTFPSISSPVQQAEATATTFSHTTAQVFPTAQSTKQPSQPQSQISMPASATVQPTMQPKSVNEPVASIPQPKTQATPSQSIDAQNASDEAAYIATEVRSNMAEYEKEIKALKISIDNVLKNVTIGSPETFDSIKCSPELLDGVVEELSTQFAQINSEVNVLEKASHELQYMAQDVKSLCDRDTDPSYRNILLQRNLDPILAKKVQEIHRLRDYIEVQIRELNTKFDQEWHEWLQKRKSNNLSSSKATRKPAPTHPFRSFITDTNDDEEEMEERLVDDGKEDIRNIQLVISKNQRLIDHMRSQLKEKIFQNLRNFGADKDQNELEQLNAMLEKLTINKNEKKASNSEVLVQCLPSQQKLVLKSFFENRHVATINSGGPCMLNASDSTLPNRSKSLFISALENIEKKKKERISQGGDTLSAPSSGASTSKAISQNIPTPPTTSLFGAAQISATKSGTLPSSTFTQSIKTTTTQSIASPITTSSTTTTKKVVPTSNPPSQFAPITKPKDSAQATEPSVKSVNFNLTNILSSKPKVDVSPPVPTASTSSASMSIFSKPISTDNKTKEITSTEAKSLVKAAAPTTSFGLGAGQTSTAAPSKPAQPVVTPSSTLNFESKLSTTATVASVKPVVTTTVPTFSFAKPAVTTTVPTFSFPKPAPTTTVASFSFSKPAPTTTTASGAVAKPAFSFGGAIAKLPEEDKSVSAEAKVTGPVATTIASTTTAATSSSGVGFSFNKKAAELPTQSSQQSEVSSSTNAFPAPLAKAEPKSSVVAPTTTVTVQTPAPTASSFSFSKAAESTFSMGGLNICSPEKPATTTATTTGSIFGGASGFSFGGAFASISGGTTTAPTSLFGAPITTSNTTSIFSNTPATTAAAEAVSSTSSSFFSPVSSSSSNNNNNKPLWPSTPQPSSTLMQPAATTPSLFGQQAPGTSLFGGTPQPQQSSLFGSLPGFGGGLSTPAPAPAAALPAALQTPPAQPAFGSPPVFGGSPAFGGSPSFGGAPTFGSPSFGGGFGAQPGQQQQQQAMPQQTSLFSSAAGTGNQSFGNFFMKDTSSSGLTFDSLAADNNQNNALPPSGSFFGNQATTFSQPTFTQRRK